MIHCRFVVWWSQLVTCPLWAQELSFELLLEIASRHIQREEASFLPERVPELCLPILAMSSQVYNLPFGMPLSFHNRYTKKNNANVSTSICNTGFQQTCRVQILLSIVTIYTASQNSDQDPKA
jgi:hypothetical protein